MVRPCVQDDKPRALASGYRSNIRANHTQSCLHLVNLWVSDIEHLKGAISWYRLRIMIDMNSFTSSLLVFLSTLRKLPQFGCLLYCGHETILECIHHDCSSLITEKDHLNS